jgi:hypothetical protein
VEGAIYLMLSENENPNELNAEQVEDIQFFFNDMEAAVGYASGFGPMINRLNGLGGSGSGAALQPFEHFACWSNPQSQRSMVVRRALHRMMERGEGHLVAVLHRRYGPRDPAARYDVLGKLAPLAEYTAAAWEKRAELAAILGQTRVTLLRRREEAREQSRALRLVKIADRALTLSERLKEARGRSDAAREVHRGLREELRATRRARAAAHQPALDPEARARVELSIRAQANREVTTFDAVQALLGPIVERRKKESGKAFRRRRDQTLAPYAEGIARVKAEAAALLVLAKRAYLDALTAGALAN